jgi:predicted N-acetyltransferase YhbS
MYIRVRRESPANRGAVHALNVAAFGQPAVMVLELQPGYLYGASGTIRYHPAFRQVDDASAQADGD